MYYLSSENKGADQLRGYREADLRLCFRICKKKTVFSQRGSIIFVSFILTVPEAPQITSLSAGTRSITVVLMPPLVVNGLLKNYIVTVDTTADFSSAIYRIQSVDNETSTTITISGLEPFQLYYVKVIKGHELHVPTCCFDFFQFQHIR